MLIFLHEIPKNCLRPELYIRGEQVRPVVA